MTTCPRVLVTRAAEQTAEISAALRVAGLEPVVVPLVEVTPIDPGPQGWAALAPDQRYDLLALTSANAAQFAAVAARAAGAELIDLVRGGVVVAVGPATAAEAARVAGFGAHPSSGPELRVAPRANAEGVLEALSGLQIRGRRALVPRARGGREVVSEGLRAAGARVREVELYQTSTRTEAAPALLAALSEGLGAILLLSPSTARALAELSSGATLPPIVCIGDTTAAEVQRLGLGRPVVAGKQSVDGLVEALSDHLGMTPLGGDA